MSMIISFIKRLIKISLILLIIIFAVGLMAIFKDINDNKRLPRSLNEKSAESLSREDKSRVFWRQWSEGSFHIMQHEETDFKIEIVLHGQEEKRVPFQVTLSTKYPAHKSYVIGQYDNLTDITALEIADQYSYIVPKYDEEKGIYIQQKQTEHRTPERKIVDLYGTDVVFKNNTSQLVKKVKVGRAVLFGAPNTEANINLTFGRLDEVNQNNFDDVLMFIANSPDEWIEIEMLDSKGRKRKHKVYTGGVYEWVFSLRDEAVYMGF